MLTMTGLGSGGDNCDPNTTWYQSDPNMAYYGSCIPFTALPNSSTSTAKPSTQTTSGTPWWGSILTSLTAGVTKGIIGNDGQPAAAAAAPVYVPPPPPWYTTPTGMIGIGVGALALYMLLKK